MPGFVVAATRRNERNRGWGRRQPMEGTVSSSWGVKKTVSSFTLGKSRTRARRCAALAHPLRLHGPRRPPTRVHRHRHRTGALYNAADVPRAPGRSSFVWPPLGIAPLTSGQAAEAISWLHRQAHELLTFWPPASASAATTAAISHNHLKFPFHSLPPFTGGLIRQSIVDRLLAQAADAAPPTNSARHERCTRFTRDSRRSRLQKLRER